jgi:hypothetical protein
MTKDQDRDLMLELYEMNRLLNEKTKKEKSEKDKTKKQKK